MFKFSKTLLFILTVLKWINEAAVVIISMIHMQNHVFPMFLIYTIKFVIAVLIIICTSGAFIYFHWYLKSDTNITNINPSAEAVIYWTYKWEILSKLILKMVILLF